MSEVISEHLAAAVTAYDKGSGKPLLDVPGPIVSYDAVDRVDTEKVVSRRDKFIHASAGEEKMPVVVRHTQPEMLLDHCNILLTSAHRIRIALEATPRESKD